MKKQILTIAIVLGMTVHSFGQVFQTGGGLFKRGTTDEKYYGMGTYDGGFLNASSRTLTTGGELPIMPSPNNTHDQTVPLGDGLLLLGIFGGAYLLGKRRK